MLLDRSASRSACGCAGRVVQVGLCRTEHNPGCLGSLHLRGFVHGLGQWIWHKLVSRRAGKPSPPLPTPKNMLGSVTHYCNRLCTCLQHRHVCSQLLCFSPAAGTRGCAQTTRAADAAAAAACCAPSSRQRRQAPLLVLQRQQAQAGRQQGAGVASATRNSNCLESFCHQVPPHLPPPPHPAARPNLQPSKTCCRHTKASPLLPADAKLTRSRKLYECATAALSCVPTPPPSCCLCCKNCLAGHVSPKLCDDACPGRLSCWCIVTQLG